MSIVCLSFLTLPTQNFMWVLQKIFFFLTQLCSFFLKSFLHQIAEMYEFTDFISILAYASYLISVILEFFKKKGNPRWRIKDGGPNAFIQRHLTS